MLSRIFVLDNIMVVVHSAVVLLAGSQLFECVICPFIQCSVGWLVGLFVSPLKTQDYIICI